MKPDFPRWDLITPSFARSELDRLLVESERAVAAVEADDSADYEKFVWALDDATRELWQTWGYVSHLLGVMNSQEWRDVQEDYQGKMVEFTLRVSQSEPIYARAKAVRAAMGDGADKIRLRIVDKMIESAELAGVGLTGEKRKRFNEIQTELAKLGADFANAVIDATAAFKYEKDGKTYTIDDAAYMETMRECPDREVREKLLRARSTRAPENVARIREELALRRESAALLGFGSYADLSVASKCAPSVAAVFKMIDELDAATVAPAAAEERELAELPEAPADGVMPWDVKFLSERLREAKYSYSEDELKRHFELEDVLDGLFRMTKFLFGVDVVEVTGGDKPSTWHPDVRFFTVRDGGEDVAHFYFDPYVRLGQKRGGAWMNEFRNRNDRLGATPLSLMVLNIKAPDADGKTYMPMREVETLFHEFGHNLQCLLTRVGEEDAAGINLVEWDAVEVASQFMENWCLDNRTGIAIPEDLKAKVKAARNFRAATDCRRQLAFAKTDLLLHGADEVPDPNELKKTVFGHFGTPIVPEDLFLCGFTHIFAGAYSAGYYSYKWSEVMSADCYGAFEEAGLDDDEAVRRVGRAYRDTILAKGGGENALAVFRSFRGRDPEIAALLRQQGLLPEGSAE
ncbi:MAG: M3 family metallopeptidase [Kiritimatiellae bacterium]|nr:M3 family metallopeptidase [Kiritimatiellia bacterium]